MNPSLIISIYLAALIVVVKSQQPQEEQNHGMTAENVFHMNFQPVTTVPPPWEPSYQYGEANGVIYGQAPYYPPSYYPPPYYPPRYGYPYPYPPPPPYYPPYYYPEYYSQPEEVESHQALTQAPTQEFTTTTTTTTTTPAPPPAIVPTPGAFYGPAPLWRQLSRSVSPDQAPALPALPLRQQMRRDVGGRIRCEIYPDTEDVNGSRREGRMRCIIDP